MIIAGLTGGIASGKSTVSSIFQRAGAVVIDADVLAHQVVARGWPAWKAIKSEFGDQVIQADGEIDRLALGRMVFNNQSLRKRLEAIIHPQVRIRMDDQLRRLRRARPHAVVIQDIPLLFETGMTQNLSEIIVVYAPPAVQLQRLVLRDGMERDAALARIYAQTPLTQKCRLATMVIDNRGKPAETERQVLNIYGYLSGKA